MASNLYPKIDAALNKEKFMSKLVELANKQDLRSQRLMAKMMGFADLQQFEGHQQRKYNAINNLLERYPQLGDEQHQSTIHSAIKLINESDLVYGNNARASATCYEKYQNCFDSANANLWLASVGCAATVAVPGIGAVLVPACEIGAILKHYNDVTACEYAYEDCI